MKTDLCILAAGFSSRFHGNKLLAEIDGKMLIQYVFDAVDPSLFNRVFVVTQYACVVELAKNYGFIPLMNPDPSRGLSSSIHCGVAHCEVDQLMFLVADQPWIESETLQKIVATSDGEHIVAASLKGDLRNPMLFPKKYFEQLLNLEKDQGAKRVAKGQSCILVEVMSKELFDIDTKSDLEGTLYGLNVERKEK